MPSVTETPGNKDGMGHSGGLLEGGLDTLHESWKSRQGPPEVPWARGQHPVQTPITGSVTEEGGCGPGRRAWESGDGTHPAPPLTDCVPSGKSPHFLKPHIPHLENRVDQATCFLRLYVDGGSNTARALEALCQQ